MERITITVLCLCALVSMACEEPAPPSKVHGTVECSACAQTFNVSGELSEGDSKYYGYCKTDDADNLKFVVGTSDRTHATASSDFFLQIAGIQGPPTEGVYCSTPGQAINSDGCSGEDDENLYTGFEQGFIKNVNEFAFSQGDAADEELCVVELYAVPIEGELDPKQGSFDYYMSLDCRTLDIPSASGESLNWVRAQLWFGNCG
jgi:hypothetical protein